MLSFHDLPDEIIYSIDTYFDDNDLIRLSETDKRFRQIALQVLFKRKSSRANEVQKAVLRNQFRLLLSVEDKTPFLQFLQEISFFNAFVMAKCTSFDLSRLTLLATAALLKHELKKEDLSEQDKDALFYVLKIASFAQKSRSDALLGALVLKDATSRSRFLNTLYQGLEYPSNQQLELIDKLYLLKEIVLSISQKDQLIVFSKLTKIINYTYLRNSLVLELVAKVLALLIPLVPYEEAILVVPGLELTRLNTTDDTAVSALNASIALIPHLTRPEDKDNKTKIYDSFHFRLSHPGGWIEQDRILETVSQTAAYFAKDRESLIALQAPIEESAKDFAFHSLKQAENAIGELNKYLDGNYAHDYFKSEPLLEENENCFYLILKRITALAHFFSEDELQKIVTAIVTNTSRFDNRMINRTSKALAALFFNLTDISFLETIILNALSATIGGNFLELRRAIAIFLGMTQHFEKLKTSNDLKTKITTLYAMFEQKSDTSLIPALVILSYFASDAAMQSLFLTEHSTEIKTAILSAFTEYHIKIPLSPTLEKRLVEMICFEISDTSPLYELAIELIPKFATKISEEKIPSLISVFEKKLSLDVTSTKACNTLNAFNALLPRLTKSPGISALNVYKPYLLNSFEFIKESAREGISHLFLLFPELRDDKIIPKLQETPFDYALISDLMPSDEKRAENNNEEEDDVWRWCRIL
jgi:hypothetical protein